MRLRKKRVAFVVMTLCLIVAFICGRFYDLKAQSKRKNVLSVYKNALEQPYMNWDELESYENLTSSHTSLYEFGLIDLNGDGCYELIIKNPMTSFVSGQYRLYTVIDGELKELQRAQTIEINDQTHIISCTDAYMGHYWGEYSRLDEKGQLEVLATYEAVDTYTNPERDIIYAGRINGVSVRYTICRIGEQEVAYEEFIDQVNEMVDNGVFYKVPLVPNTEDNRLRLL